MTYSPAVTHHEEADTRQESLSLEGFTASVTLRCNYADRYDLCSDLLLSERAWPHMPASIAPIARSCEIVNEGMATPVGSLMHYQDSLVTVRYSHEQKNLAIEEMEPTVNFQTLDHRQFRWSGGDILLDSEAPGRQIKGLNFVKTFFYVTSIPPTFLSLVGHVNTGTHVATIMSGLSFGPETLLYTPPHVSRTVTIGSGLDLFTVKLRFAYQHEGWNKHWRAKTEQYEEIVHHDTGNVYKNFPVASFSSLFALPQVV